MQREHRTPDHPEDRTTDDARGFGLSARVRLLAMSVSRSLPNFRGKEKPFGPSKPDGSNCSSTTRSRGGRPRRTLRPTALCDRDGSADFYPSAEAFNSGVGTLMPGANTERTPVPVAARTGDTLIAAGSVRPPDVIKIDVEGFEYEVLCGLSQYLNHRSNLTIVFEHEPYRLRARGTPRSAIELLTSLGFTLFALSQEGAMRRLQPAMLADHADIVALGPSAAPPEAHAW